MAKTISLVIPAYNEVKNISSLISKIREIFGRDLPHYNYEVIFIDDGSHDQTGQQIITLGQNDRKIKLISLSRNFGHQMALTAGLDHADGDAVISMDCDLQDPPELIPKLISAWEGGSEIVYARRTNRSDSFLKKYTAIWYYKLLDNFSDVKIPRNVGDFRLLDKNVLCQLRRLKEKNRYLRGMVAWMGFRHSYIDFERPNRTDGKTGYSLKKMLELAMNGILSFSLLPLKVGLMFGVLSIVSGIVFLIYMFFDAIANNTEYPLYKWLAVISLIFIGFQFMLIWILGEYVGRIYNESKNRPMYIIGKKINFDE